MDWDDGADSLLLSNKRPFIYPGYFEDCHRFRHIKTLPTCIWHTGAFAYTSWHRHPNTHGYLHPRLIHREGTG